MLGEVVFFTKYNTETSSRGVSGDAGAIDAAADDEDIRRFERFVIFSFHAYLSYNITSAVDTLITPI